MRQMFWGVGKFFSTNKLIIEMQIYPWIHHCGRVALLALDSGVHDKHGVQWGVRVRPCLLRTSVARSGHVRITRINTGLETCQTSRSAARPCDLAEVTHLINSQGNGPTLFLRRGNVSDVGPP